MKKGEEIYDGRFEDLRICVGRRRERLGSVTWMSGVWGALSDVE